MWKAEAGEPQIFEWQARRRAGEVFWVEANIRRASIGNREALLIVAHNITERKLAQDEKIRLAAQLR